MKVLGKTDGQYDIMYILFINSPLFMTEVTVNMISLDGDNPSHKSINMHHFIYKYISFTTSLMNVGVPLLVKLSYRISQSEHR